MWTVIGFDPFPGKETVGSISVVWNQGQADEFIFNSTVNLDQPETVQSFVQESQKTLAQVQAKRASQSDMNSIRSKQLSALANTLNGGK